MQQELLLQKLGVFRQQLGSVLESLANSTSEQFASMETGQHAIKAKIEGLQEEKKLLTSQLEALSSRISFLDRETLDEITSLGDATRFVYNPSKWIVSVKHEFVLTAPAAIRRCELKQDGPVSWSKVDWKVGGTQFKGTAKGNVFKPCTASVTLYAWRKDIHRLELIDSRIKIAALDKEKKKIDRTIEETGRTMQSLESSRTLLESTHFNCHTDCAMLLSLTLNSRLSDSAQRCLASGAISGFAKAIGLRSTIPESQLGWALKKGQLAAQLATAVSLESKSHLLAIQSCEQTAQNHRREMQSQKNTLLTPIKTALRTAELSGSVKGALDPETTEKDETFNRHFQELVSEIGDFENAYTSELRALHTAIEALQDNVPWQMEPLDKMEHDINEAIEELSVLDAAMQLLTAQEKPVGVVASVMYNEDPIQTWTQVCLGEAILAKA